MKLSQTLLATSVIFYIFYDIVSTLAAYRYLGSFEYEKSLLIKLAFDLAGVQGFIAFKLLVSAGAILTAFYLMERYHRFSGFGTGILSGASLAGLFVGTSNLNILFNGSSFWVLGYDSGTVAASIILACAFGGLVYTRWQRSPAPSV